jgi:hypothetical protein
MFSAISVGGRCTIDSAAQAVMRGHRAAVLSCAFDSVTHRIHSLDEAANVRRPAVLLWPI